MGGGVATQGDVDGPQWRCWVGLSGHKQQEAWEIDLARTWEAVG